MGDESLAGWLVVWCDALCYLRLCMLRARACLFGSFALTVLICRIVGMAVSWAGGVCSVWLGGGARQLVQLIRISE